MSMNIGMNTGAMRAHWAEPLVMKTFRTVASSRKPMKNSTGCTPRESSMSAPETAITSAIPDQEK